MYSVEYQVSSILILLCLYSTSTASCLALYAVLRKINFAFLTFFVSSAFIKMLVMSGSPINADLLLSIVSKHCSSQSHKYWTGVSVRSVTTVPLSVCYGALNLSVCVDASNLVPYACDRPVTRGECEGGSGSTVPSSAISRGSVAAEQSYRTSGTITPVFSVLRWVWKTGALCWLYVLSFYNSPDSLISTPLVSSQVPYFVPQEKKSARCCRFESLSDSGFIAPNMAFYRPYKAQIDI